MAIETKGRFASLKPCAFVVIGSIFVLIILHNVSTYFFNKSSADNKSPDYNDRRSFKDTPIPKPHLALLKKLKRVRIPHLVTSSRKVDSALLKISSSGSWLSLTPTSSFIAIKSSSLQLEYLSTTMYIDSHKQTTVIANQSSSKKSKKMSSPLELRKEKLSILPTSIHLQTQIVQTVTAVGSTNYSEAGVKQDKKKKFPVAVHTEVVKADSCKPRHKVMFLKTHKTGGSTITNVLNRYADEHNLVIALPGSGFNRFNYPRLFSPSSVDRSRIPGAFPDILCNHALYKQKPLESVMSKNATFITILRNPVTNFESVFYYMEVAHSCGIKETDNVEMISKFFRSSCKTFHFLAKNGMLFDLGLSASEASDAKLVKRHIRNLAKRFQLVLLMEYFDESLVLLKRLLCWQLEDVAYFVFLQSATKRNPLPQTLQKSIRNWNSGDVLLYEHFNRTFWKKVASEGKGFYEEVEQLRKLNLKLKQQCTEGDYTHLGYGQAYSRIKSFHMKKNLSKDIKGRCCRMLRSEVNYIKYHRIRQSPSRTNTMPEC